MFVSTFLYPHFVSNKFPKHLLFPIWPKQFGHQATAPQARLRGAAGEEAITNRGASDGSMWIIFVGSKV